MKRHHLKITSLFAGVGSKPVKWNFSQNFDISVLALTKTIDRFQNNKQRKKNNTTHILLKA